MHYIFVLFGHVAEIGEEALAACSLRAALNNTHPRLFVSWRAAGD